MPSTPRALTVLLMCLAASGLFGQTEPSFVVHFPFFASGATADRSSNFEVVVPGLKTAFTFTNSWSEPVQIQIRLFDRLGASLEAELFRDDNGPGLDNPFELHAKSSIDLVLSTAGVRGHNRSGADREQRADLCAGVDSLSGNHLLPDMSLASL